MKVPEFVKNYVTVTYYVKLNDIKLSGRAYCYRFVQRPLNSIKLKNFSVTSRHLQAEIDNLCHQITLN